MSTTTDWLRGLGEPELIGLLRARPDLAVPAPTDLASLARRLDTPPSVWRAMENLNQFEVQILTALVVLGAPTKPVTPAQVAAFLGRSAAKKQITLALVELEKLALARGSTYKYVPASVAEALGPYPGGLGPETSLDFASVATKLTSVPERGLAILERLAQGPPVGSVGAGAAIGPIVRDLINIDLLISRGSGSVELPREVGLHFRGKSPLGAIVAAPVRPDPATVGQDPVDGTAAGQSLELLRQLHRTLDLLAAQPPAVLKAGGLGIRESKKLAKELGADESQVSLYLEVLAAGGLITGAPALVNRGLKVWAATSTADEWLASPDEQAWSAIVQVWLDLRRDPARAGKRDINDKILGILTPELTWLRGPADRRWVLAPLAALPSGSGWTPEQLGQVLAWEAPLRGADRRDRVVSTVLGQATTMGIVAFNSLSSAGRALLEGSENVASTLAKSLPVPLETFLVQADLTVIAPGRLTSILALRLAAAAEVESAGSATVYRVTPASIRRALDTGLSRGELHQLFDHHSSTPIPQALTYLIDDVARRHGVLRTGHSEAYLRCDDTVMVDQAIAHMASVGIVLRKLAPTVAITRTSLDELIVELRKAGLAPAAEDEFGAILTKPATVTRAKPPLVTHQRWREPATPNDEQLAALVARMRFAESSNLVSVQSPTEALAELRAAATARGSVWIEYVNTEGATSRRLIEPLAISGGTISAFDRLSKQMRTFAVHRIVGIQDAGPADEA
ncbi:helicase-associated domain-containing protein [Nakamurella antarctica]|nr:helicase-associated domain-containing protein [Nakamurella antarctica]